MQNLIEQSWPDLLLLCDSLDEAQDFVTKPVREKTDFIGALRGSVVRQTERPSDDVF